jgi:uncharacterized membrane protein
LRRWRRFCAIGLLIAATLWAAAILVAPRVVAVGAEHPVLSGLGGLTYVVGSLVCHQRPERSFHLAAVQYPVCARCMGIYLAAPVGIILGMWGVGGSRRSRRFPVSIVYRRWRLILGVAILPTAVSIIVERLGGPTGLGSRAVAAVPLGLAAAGFVAAVVLGHFAQDVSGRAPRLAGPGTGV